MNTLNKKSYKKQIATNKKVYHDYFVEDKIEAGISLSGTEIKSLRQGSGSIKEAYIRLENNEAYIYGMHINPYEKGNIFNVDPIRSRKLLLHKKEIRNLATAVAKDGYTVVPLEVYISGNYAKVLIALAKGKKNYDKRETIAKRDMKRNAEREFKEKVKQ